MTKYIKLSDAEKAMQRLEEEDIERYGVSIPEGFNAEPAIEALNGIKPSDVEEVRRGRWILIAEIESDYPKDNKAIVRTYECSNCPLK